MVQGSDNSAIKANFVIECKDNLTYSLMLFKFTKRFNSVFSGVPYMKDSQEYLMERRGTAFGILNNLLHKFEKDFSDPIRQGRMTLDFVNKNVGGDLVIHCIGTPQEIEEWTKITLREKASMLLVRKWLNVRVDRVTR